MPPCAATVWERVGNTLVMQAVPQAGCAADDRPQSGAAGADHHDIVSVIFDRIGPTIMAGALPPFFPFSAISYLQTE